MLPPSNHVRLSPFGVVRHRPCGTGATLLDRCFQSDAMDHPTNHPNFQHVVLAASRIMRRPQAEDTPAIESISSIREIEFLQYTQQKPQNNPSHPRKNEQYPQDIFNHPLQPTIFTARIYTTVAIYYLQKSINRNGEPDKAKNF